MQVTRDSQLQIPNSLRQTLLAFRRRVWCLKMLEAIAGAVIGLLVGFLVTYTLDRFIDTPRAIRMVVLAASVAACACIPMAVQRWIWRRRRMDQLARLLSQTHPRAGDQLLGVIELSEDASEQSRSPELVEAAIAQVAEDVAHQDLSAAIPNPKHKQRLLIAGVLASAATLLLVLTAAAATNAWARFLAPWKDTPRYTFASIEPLPSQLVVPHGESFQVSIGLRSDTEWQPASAEVSLAGQTPKQSSLQNRQYRFDLPGQIEPSDLQVRVGDFKGVVPVQPMLRPELSSVSAEIQLPKYLGRQQPIAKEIRGATVSVVKGSAATLKVTASRELADASVNGIRRSPVADQFSTETLPVNRDTAVVLQWEDQYGLTGKQPYELSIQAVDDQSPSLVCEGLPRRKVLLDSEVLSFKVRARDDFGVKKVGIQWQGLDEAMSVRAAGEKTIGAGNFQAELLDLTATFCARDEQIQPQVISFRVFVEDFLPGRERVYSPDCTFEILDPEQHAIWISSQLSRWHRMSLDVRDREMQLHETNKQLRSMPAAELTQPENLERLATQAERERANGRQLAGLVRSGEALLKEAMRNSEIGVGHLERWAEMMQVLKDISGNRMPSVADLLKQASEGQPLAQQASDPNKAPQVGENRLTQSGAGQPKKPAEGEKPPTQVPSVTDIESTHQQFDENELTEPSDSKPKQPRLTLLQTQLAGNAKQDSKPPADDEGPLDQAVNKQQDLLAEFDKIADELSAVLANLEGSTLVKRLKASSRKQQQVASRLASLVSNSFGVSEREKEADAATFAELAAMEAANSQEASHIMDDMSAYFQRSRYMLFGRVLDDMREQDVTAGLRQLGDELRKENGLSIAQAEYWSDTFDRWAEDLVEVTQSGACPGAKAKGSLPPSIVLEVLQLLEGEVQLREQTRVAEQARPAVSDTEHMVTANRLSESQDAFQLRMDKVIKRIEQLPDSEADFAKELGLLSQVSGVMQETTEILAKPETGPPAIAAETEIIELLLKSSRFNPSAGGGGGAQPGGGGDGDTETPALALVGAGVNENEVREEMSATQATGTTGPGMPEEFRNGLDQYFHRLEKWRSN